MLMRGSSERKQEATVQRKNNRMGRSNRVRRTPVERVAIVRVNQPPAAMASEISAAAIE